MALALPPTHVFEGMRALMMQHTFRLDFMLYALLLNAVFLTIGFCVFHFFLRSARINGTLVQLGE